MGGLRLFLFLSDFLYKFDHAFTKVFMVSFKLKIEWLGKNYKTIMLFYILFVVVLIAISHLDKLPFIGTGLVLSVGIENPSYAGEMVGKVILFVLSILAAFVAYLASRIFGKEIKKALFLISLGMTIFSAGYLLEIEAAVGLKLPIEITPLTQSIIGIVAFFMILNGLFEIYRVSVKAATNNT